MTQNAWDSTIPVGVPKGGTGAPTLTDGGFLLGSGTGAITATGQPTNGQLAIGSTGTDPSLGVITSTGGTITVTNGAGTINLETPGSATACFSAYVNSDINNVTGDGSFYTIIFNAEDFDVGGGFDTGTGVFTAPVAGKYLFSTSVDLGDVNAAHDGCNLRYVASIGATHASPQSVSPGAIRDNVNNSNLCASSIIANMASGETISISIQVSGSTKTVDILGQGVATPRISFFTGCLLI